MFLRSLQILTDKAPPTFGAALSWIAQALLIAAIAYYLDRKTDKANMQKIKEIN